MNHVASMTRTPAIAPISAADRRSHEGTRGGDRDEPGEHAVGNHPGIRLAGAAGYPQHRDRRPERSGDRRVRCNGGELDVGGGERRGGVEAEPAEQEDERAEQGHRDVVSGERAWLAVAAVLADAWAEHEGAGEGSRAADGVDDA